MDFKKLIRNKVIVFDGAMGTMIQRSGISIDEIPENYNIENQDLIRKIHRTYLENGADIITTNTFGANRLKLINNKYNVETVIKYGVKLAKKEAKRFKNKYVALDIGPTGSLIEPLGDLKFEKAYEIFKEQVKIGVSAGCDLIIFETFSNIYELKAAVLAAKENSQLPIIATMTFNQNKRTLTGTDPLTMVTILESLKVDALGMNCSLGPLESIDIAKEILKYSTIPVLIQPNAGMPSKNSTYNVSSKEFTYYMQKIINMGADLVGGCCGTDEKYIKNLKRLSLSKIKVKRKVKYMTKACSFCKTTVIGQETKIIGERINPTGKNEIKDALIKKDYGVIVKEALVQKENDANILDINVGVPDINEKRCMEDVIKEIQQVVDLPLQIDTSNIETLKRALRIYNGKPIINSTTAEEASMNKIFPLAKKYGALVVALTLDEKGIPKTLEKRIEIANKIIKKAVCYGIKKEDIIIDPLVLTLASEQDKAVDTLNAVKIIKEKFNVCTLLGISNISYGLPNRDLLNSTYLTMALTYGVDLVIVNPLSLEIEKSLKVFRALMGEDIQIKKYVEAYKDTKSIKKSKSLNKLDLKECILKGILDEALKQTNLLLKKENPLVIINDYIVPSLEEIGVMYSKGEVFLPELLKSANIVEECFKPIKSCMKKSNCKETYKGKIILATVQGDVHDIGKNIVKALIESYNYKVIDLGKNISSEIIIKKALEEKPDYIGLSALMTTTVKSMENTIKDIKKANIKSKIIVGGAVLTKSYAKSIGADFFAKDAIDAIQILKNN